jgi:hypothetical protein
MDNRLAPTGFIDFSSYRREMDSVVAAQPLNDRSGKLAAISVGKDGKPSIQPGWPTTHPPRNSNGRDGAQASLSEEPGPHFL